MKSLAQEIPVARLFANPDQPRRFFDEDELFALAQSIRAEGVLQPLRVRPCDDRFMIVMGERRWRAARQAGLQTVPCIIEDAALPAERNDIRAVVENELRSDLAPMELANALKRIMAANGWTGAEAAAHLNLTPARVSRALALLRLPEAVQAKVASGEISPAKAYELSKLDDPAMLREAANLAASGATRDQLAGAARRSRQTAEKCEPVRRVTAKLAGNRSLTVQGVIASLDDFIAAAEEVLAKARKARTQGVEVGTFVKMLADQAKQPA